MTIIAQWAGFFAGVALLICIFILPWLAIFRKTRAAGGAGYVIASYVFGGTLWTMCFLTVWDAWGPFWAVVGVLVLGVGVLPMSLVIFAMGSQWWLFGEVLVIGALALSVRLLGIWLIEKAK